MQEVSAPHDFTEVTKIQERAVGEAIAGLQDKNVVLIEAPTGAGKTRINSRIIEEFVQKHGREPKVLMLQHREMLAAQGEAALEKWTSNVRLSTSSAVDGNLDQSGDVVYATVQTAAARVDELVKYDLVGIDEAHHASDAKTGDYATVLPRLVEKNPDIKIVAVTATPSRPDGKDLSPLLQNAARVTIGWAELERAGQIKLPQTLELRVPAKNGGTTAQVAAKHFRPEKDANAEGLTKAIREARTDSFNDDMADAWERYAFGRRTIAFASRIKDAQSFSEEMKSRGHRVAVVHSKAGDDHNIQALADYGAGKLDMIVSVKMIDEGLDVPATRCILILRETTSATEYHQMVGRATRAGDDPELRDIKPLVLDGGASTMIHGAVERRAAIIDYYQKLERGELPKERPAELAADVGKITTTYTPWRKMKDQPVVLALSDGDGVIFAVESRDVTGEPRYTLAEAKEVKGRAQVTFMKDDAGKPLNGIDGPALQAIEIKRMIPSRATLLRMEAALSKSGRSLIDERIAEVSETSLSTAIQFAAMSQRASLGR